MIWLAMEVLISLFSRYGRLTFFDTRLFPWVAALESRWPAIRSELEAVLLDRERIPNFREISADQTVLAGGEQWKTFFFYTAGNRAEENCARCPNTVDALAQIPAMQSAMFSILSPGAHLPPHRGLYKGVLRYHLALIVPEPKSSCGLRIRDQVRCWEEGKSLIFDDTYRHEAWNNSGCDRVVLFVDFERPLPAPLSALNRFILHRFGESEYIGKAVERVRKASSAPASEPAGQN